MPLVCLLLTSLFQALAALAALAALVALVALPTTFEHQAVNDGAALKA